MCGSSEIELSPTCRSFPKLYKNSLLEEAKRVFQVMHLLSLRQPRAWLTKERIVAIPSPQWKQKKLRQMLNAPAESESTPTATTSTNVAQSTKPVILLPGYTFRQETNENGPTYEDLLEEARYFYGKDNTQLPGAIRDKARIVRLLDRGFDCFCVSKSNKDENDESMLYYGDFCDRKFVEELREKLSKHETPHPVQACVDCE